MQMSDTQQKELTSDGWPAKLLDRISRQRTENPSLCDVIVRCDDGVEGFPGHRNVLAASSEYFRALFTNGLPADVDGIYNVALSGTELGISRDPIEHVLDFMYTGKITVSVNNIAEVLRLADFLCVSELTLLCVKYMSSVNLCSPELCVLFLQLVETFRLSLNSKPLIARVHQSVSKQLPQIFAVIGGNISDLPTLIIRQLLADPEIGSASESKICNAICQLATKRPDDVTVLDLLHHVEFDYLGTSFVRQKLLTNSKLTKWLDQRRPEVLTALRERVGRQTADSVVDVIICGRCNPPPPGGATLCVSTPGVTTTPAACLLVYVVENDEWVRLLLLGSEEESLQPSLLPGSESPKANPPGLIGDWLEGLECTMTEGHWLYALCIIESGSTIFRRFCRLDLSTGVGLWRMLPSPSVVKSQCRMVVMLDDIYAVDKSGVVERYSTSNDSWTVICQDGCPRNGFSQHTTLYILPVFVVGQQPQLFALRVDSFGANQAYHVSRSSCNVVLYTLGHGQSAWKTQARSEISITYLLYSSTSSVEPSASNFLDYIVTPATVRLLDEVARERACNNFLASDWKSIVTLQNIRPRPDFVGAKVLGSLTHGARVYCSCIGSANFVMYDVTRRRYKAVCSPPDNLSGVLSHSRLPRSVLTRLAGVRQNDRRVSGADGTERAEKGEASASQKTGYSGAGSSSS